MQNLYIIAGPNGAGKTTASFTVLPEMLNCKEFVNADEIAKGISPFQPESVAIDAGRIFLKRIQELIKLKKDFGFETTLSTKSYVNTIRQAKLTGYNITMVFFWLNSPKLATERVKSRVEAGGHNIPQDVIARRYLSGIKNLFHLYIPISDYWMVIDNSSNPFCLVADGNSNFKINIYKKTKWETIKDIIYEK
ncbi:MAG: zeta toxin family protein [Bacteroidales bacterium]|nr:zeta toxin family protein [Bacteroidales bacterium]